MKPSQPDTRSQRLLLATMLIGAVCAMVLAGVGVCMVLATVLGAVPIPILVLLGAGIGAVGWRVHTRESSR